MLVIGVLVAPAHAVELVWVGGVPADADAVASSVGADRPPRDLAHLRSARTRYRDADARALEALDSALAAARPYETQLDGELHILDLLEPAVQAVTVLRSPADAAALFGALAYEGFAVNRYFGLGLATDPDAARWRGVGAPVLVEAPWLDAIALDPERRATAYDIAEAPQRVAFQERRTSLAGALPGRVILPDLPTGATLVIDGRVGEAGSGGVLTLPPGRHLFHAELQGRIVERFDVRVASGKRQPVDALVDQSAFDAFVADLAPGVPVPPAIQALLDALDAPIYLARATDRGVQVLDPSGGVLREVTAGPDRATHGPQVQAAVGVLGGWLASNDFYLQDPRAHPATFATVNAVAVGGYASVQAVMGGWAVGVGVDVLVPPGEAHVALSGNQRVRVRPIPHVAVGIRALQACVGFMAPYHPAIGARAQLPVTAGVHARVAGWVGPGLRQPRIGATDWQGSPVFSVVGGVGYTFTPPTRRGPPGPAAW